MAFLFSVLFAFDGETRESAPENKPDHTKTTTKLADQQHARAQTNGAQHDEREATASASPPLPTAAQRTNTGSSTAAGE
jgi:hypothetical protein